MWSEEIQAGLSVRVSVLSKSTNQCVSGGRHRHELGHLPGVTIRVETAASRASHCQRELSDAPSSMRARANARGHTCIMACEGLWNAFAPGPDLQNRGTTVCSTRARTPRRAKGTTTSELATKEQQMPQFMHGECYCIPSSPIEKELANRETP